MTRVPTFKPGDIISYQEACLEEGATLQRGMNFRLRSGWSVILMSLRRGAPYADRIEEDGRVLIYEGHDTPRRRGGPSPKSIDQPLTNPNGSPAQNGMFFRAAREFKEGKQEAELVKVYEKLRPGIWVYNGVFRLVDAWMESSDSRKVFKFRLLLTNESRQGRSVAEELEHARLIPTSVKLAVWKRDGGKCVKCGSSDNLHFDHVIPYSRGGSSLVAENVQLLCARHNLEKRDRIAWG